MSPRSERYTCTVERDGDGSVIAIEVEAVDLEGNERRVRLNGARAARVAGAVHDVLRGGGIAGRSWSSSRPIELRPLVGAHTELLLSAVKPLRRADRIDQVGEAIAGMSREEAGYWHAKSHRLGGLRALRVLTTHGAMR